MLPASLLSCGAVALGRNAAAAVGLSARISVCVSFRSGRGLVIVVGWGGRFSGASSLPTRVADARYRVRWFLCLSDTLQEFLKSQKGAIVLLVVDRKIGCHRSIWKLLFELSSIRRTKDIAIDVGLLASTLHHWLAGSIKKVCRRGCSQVDVFGHVEVFKSNAKGDLWRPSLVILVCC